MKKRSHIIEIDTDGDLNLKRLEEKYGSRLVKSSGNSIYILTYDKYVTISELDELLRDTKLDGLIEYFNLYGWTQDNDIEYGNYVLIIHTLGKPFNEVEKDFEGFKNILKVL